MFGFLKKKDVELPAQRMGAKQSGQPAQSTKVEDDMASFEIPDFSDDDLNFDLGIGEFIPKEGLPPLPEPKGLPTEPQDKPNVPIKESVPPQILQPQYNQPQGKDEEIPPIDELPKQKNVENKNLQIDNSVETNDEMIDPDAPDDLPKFNINSSIDFSEENNEKIIPAVNEVKDKKSKHQKKEHFAKSAVHTSKLPELKKGEIKHYAQASPEGFFVPKDVYRKVIILADDTSKKSVQGQDIKRSCALLEKTKKEAILDASKDTKAIKDAIMSADLRLFGGR